MAQRGILLLIDLSGYTAFLSRSELEEGAGILESLLGTLLDKIEPPLQVAEVEGDAVFAYAPEGSFQRGQTLLEALERLYFVFAAARERMQHQELCGCSGCQLLSGLDAKMVVHHGEFVLSRASPHRRPKPVGADVILAHRLLKNRITDATGVASYAFVTQACVDALGIDWLAERARRHTESYEHVGVVSGYVHDLVPSWVAERAARLVSVEDRESWIAVDREIEAPVQVVWDVVSSPEFKGLWHGASRVEAPDGRTGPGTEYRCYRGEAVMVDKVLDWRPFQRLTLDCAWPLGARIRMTLDLAPSRSGTRVVARLGQPRGATRAHSLLVRTAFRLRARGIERHCRANLDALGARATAPLHSLEGEDRPVGSTVA